MDLGVASAELDRDACLPKIGTHGEIGNGGHHGDGRGDVMEDPVATRFGEGKTDEGECADGHNGTDGLCNDESVKPKIGSFRSLWRWLDVQNTSLIHAR